LLELSLERGLGLPLTERRNLFAGVLRLGIVRRPAKNSSTMLCVVCCLFQSAGEWCGNDKDIWFWRAIPTTPAVSGPCRSTGPSPSNSGSQTFRSLYCFTVFSYQIAPQKNNNNNSLRKPPLQKHNVRLQLQKPTRKTEGERCPKGRNVDKNSRKGDPSLQGRSGVQRVRCGHTRVIRQRQGRRDAASQPFLCRCQEDSEISICTSY